MKKHKNYYLIAPASDIYAKTTQEKTIIIDQNQVSSIFDNYNIPKQFQKLVLKLSLKDNFETASELLTESTYFLKEPFIKSILSTKKKINLESIDNIIDTSCKLYQYEEVKSFYQFLIDYGFTKDYQLALKEIYPSKNIINENNKLRKIKRNEYIH